MSIVARRLGLPGESETPFTSSYRIYTRDNYLFAAAKPKTAVAYGDHMGRTLSISIIYANKGDSLSTVGAGEDHFKSEGREIDRSPLEGAMIHDAEMIARTLTGVLGKPIEQRMLGQGNQSNQARRWDWNGHSFLLTLVKEEYVGLQIVRADFADGGGRFSRVSDGDMRKRLLGNVTHLPNGDVFIDNIPMVNQGPKGYCAPATFERAMRHAGVAADMYLLATLATEAVENAPKLRTKGNYHLCMIIGYNETSNELAVSDSWGANYTIRWIHVDEAEAVNNGGGYVIDI